jgi:FkbM family methyltransferase
MNRPLLLEVMPTRVRMSLYYRFFRKRREKWLHLYSAARLKHASQARMDLLPGDGVSDSIAFTGLLEPALTNRVVKLGRQGGRFVDVGANLGYFSILWSACNPNNDCISVEASPRNLELLRKNIRQSGIESQVAVFPVAAGASRGRVQFDLGPADQTGWGGLSLTRTKNSIEVEVIRIDELVPSDRPISLMKIDVEGADTWVLQGCEKLLKAKLINEIWYEQNKPRMENLGIPLDTAQDYLRLMGYQPFPLGDPRKDLVEWRAVPDAKH